jgi:hypothetical protein
LFCANLPSGTASCSSWSFESNTAEGWAINPDFSDSGAITSIATSTAQHLAGSTYALAVGAAFDGGNTKTQMVIHVPLCANQTAVIFNAPMDFNIYFQRTGGTALAAANVLVSATTENTMTFAGSAVTVNFTPAVAEGTWLHGTSAALSPGFNGATHLGIEISISQVWTGTIYFDSLSFH